MYDVSSSRPRAGYRARGKTIGWRCGRRNITVCGESRRSDVVAASRRFHRVALALSAAVVGLTGCGPRTAQATNPSPSLHNHRGHRVSISKSARASQSISVPFAGFTMMSRSVGWATSESRVSRVYRTTDGAHRWNDVLRTRTGSGIATAFLNASDAWVMVRKRGALRVFRTTDGGRVWKASTLPALPKHHRLLGPHTASFPRKLYFVDATHGWALADTGTAGGLETVDVCKTADGGKHWTLMRHANIPRLGVKDGMMFRSDTTGWITSANTKTGTPVIEMTTNGGAQWNLQGLANASAPRGSADVSAPIFLTKSKGYLSVAMGGPTVKTVVFTTANGGRSWSPVGSVPGLDTVVFTRPSAGFATTGRHSAVTPDGGATWRTTPATGLHGRVLHIDFPSSQVGWALVVQSVGVREVLLRTANGGKSWHPVRVECVCAAS